MHFIIAFVVALIVMQILGAVIIAVFEMVSETGPIGCVVALGILAAVIILFGH